MAVEIVTCDHCLRFEKNKDTGVWAGTQETIVGRAENDTCVNWLCVVCRQPAVINGFDGAEPKTWPVDHSKCWAVNVAYTVSKPKRIFPLPPANRIMQTLYKGRILLMSR